MKRKTAVTLALGVCLAMAASVGATPMEFVAVGDAGNVATVTRTLDVAITVGPVDYEYKIGKHEVTNAQYTEFLNAVAASDPYELYETAGTGVFTQADRIARDGGPGTYTYAAVAEFADHPVAHVDWGDAARFVNWMNSGTTETGAYSLGGVFGIALKTAGAFPRQIALGFFIPTVDEWVKAAYYDGAGGYFTYGNSSNVAGDANYGGAVGNTMPVGSYVSSSPYGAKDMFGNVSEQTEQMHPAYGFDWMNREGGDYGAIATAGEKTAYFPNSYEYQQFRYAQKTSMGFRVVEIVPEPATMSLLALGGLAVLRRRRK